MAGALFGDVGASLFVAGALFGNVAVSLFVVGAAFGDVGASLFVAGAASGEIWIDSRSAKCFKEQHKMPCRWGRNSSPNGRVQFCNFMVGSCSNLPGNVNDASSAFSRFLFDFAWQA